MNKTSFMAPAVCLLVTATPAIADLMAAIDSASGSSGDTFTLGLDFTRTSGDTAMQGFSLGIEIADSSGSVIQDLDTYFNMSASYLSTVSPTPADFDLRGTFSNGFTLGVVYSFVGGWQVDVSSATTIAELVLVSRESTVGDFTIQYTTGLGAPPVAVVGVFGGASVAPTTSTGTLSIQGNTVVPGIGALGILPAAGLARRRRRR